MLNLRPVIDLTDAQFYALCQANRDLRFERTAQGDILIMSPTGGQTGRRNFLIIQQLANWTEQNGHGIGFDSSTAFKLPNGATRSPDAAWIQKTRWTTLAPEQQDKFVPLCPDFVLELRSSTDSLTELQAKLDEYLANGAQLGWLIDPQAQRIYVYRPQLPVEELAAPETVTGDPVLPGFILHMQAIW